MRPLLLAALLAACGDPAAVSADGGPPDACVPGAPLSLEGRFGALFRLNVYVNAAELVEAPGTAEILLLLDLAAGGTAVTARLCDLDIPEVAIPGQAEPLRFSPGPLLIESVAPVTTTATLDGDTACAAFSTPPVPLVIGARLDPPETAPLPEANSAGEFVACSPAGARCAEATGEGCACDQEGDGDPGATLIAENVPALDVTEAYMDLRAVLELHGRVESAALVSGVVDAVLEEKVLACRASTGALCTPATLSALQTLNPIITPLPDEPSTFTVVRIDPAWACAELLDARGTLFPR